MLITNRAIYNLMPTNYRKCKRRIPLDLIDSITISVHPQSNEFVVHIPSEYDYRLISLHRAKLLDVLKRFWKVRNHGNDLMIQRSERRDLKSLTVTKGFTRQQRRMTRLAIKELQRRTLAKLAMEKGSSNDLVKQYKRDE